jgi:UDP:flavonoid glycosyltransferase YjiC (YdhE family)
MEDSPMRVLFVCTPGLGHLFPMVPLAWALRCAGHEVLVATAGPALAAAAQAGLPVVDVAPGFNREAMLAGRKQDDPDMVQRMRRMRETRLTDLRDAAAIAARTSAPLAEGTVELARRWRPDLVVQSQIQGAGLVAAGTLGIPVVQHGFGLARTDGIAALHREHMAEVFVRHDTDLPAHIATIDVAPPSMLEGPPHGWSMRYLPYNGGAILPDWLAEPAGRPRVAVTLGTVEPRLGLGLAPAQRVITAAADIDAEFVLALGEVDTSELGRLPVNVRVAGWIPLDTLLDTCAAIVHHGGAGTTLTSLAHGVPQLVFPGPADRHINATAVARRGVGLATEPDHLDPSLLHTLLTDGALRHAAAEVRAEIAALPTPANLVGHLVEFANNPEPLPTSTP